MENLINIYNAGYVRRYHTTPMINEQNVAAHSWGVLAIILHLVENPSVELVKAAVYHDVAEKVTGDVPATFKWDNPDIANALEEAELRVMINVGINYTLTEEERIILKIADLSELVLTSIREVMMGNRYSAVIVHRGLDSLEKYYDGCGNQKVVDFITELNIYANEMENN